MNRNYNGVVVYTLRIYAVCLTQCMHVLFYKDMYLYNKHPSSD
jgi:hypothetical protein